MLHYIAIAIFLICIFSIVLCMLTCISCLGLTGILKNIISKYTSSTYDRQFIERQQNNPINSDCFICLQRIKCEVVATCNHSFCASCITSYIQSKNNQAIDCPACRKKVCVLYRRFNPTNSQQRTLKSKISQYNFQHSQQPSFFRSIFQIGSLIRQAPRLLSGEGLRFLLTNPRVKFILMMIIYAISPIDVLPQAVLGPIGLLDDSFVLMNIVQQFSGILVNFVRDQAVRDGQRQRNN